MELNLWGQALGLSLAGLLGAALGLSYDVLRPFRRRGGKVAAALLDCLFSLLSAAAAFFYAMGAESGRLGLWELAMCLLGFLLYMHFFSDIIYGLTDGLLSAALNMWDFTKNKIIFFANSAKKHFHNMRK